MKRNLSQWRRLVVAATVVMGGWVALRPAAFAAIDADSADDVCAPADNPCIVSTIVHIAGGAVLDFGGRALHVSAGGQLDFGSSSASVLCGDFQATSGIPAIHARGPDFEEYRSGTATLTARRGCSENSTSRLCRFDTDCQLGSCSVRRCSNRNSRVCDSDASCQLGPCNTGLRRCVGSTTFLRCTSNADCDFGSCPQQLTCSTQTADRVDCSANADCDFGSCSVGTASITMNSQIAGYSSEPATVRLRAADDVTISKLVNLSGGDYFDTGTLEIDAGGSVELSSEVQIPGGSLTIGAGEDVRVLAEVNLTGEDGGSAEIEAGRDLFVERSLLAPATVGNGTGGILDLIAGRDIAVTSDSALFKTRLDARGHLAEYGGQGGEVYLNSGRNLLLGTNTRVAANAEGSGGLAGWLLLISGGNAVLDGEVQLSSGGLYSLAGMLETHIGGDLTVGGNARFELIGGGDEGGGAILLESAGDIDFAGTVEQRNGWIELDSAADIRISGEILLREWEVDPDYPHLEIAACRVTLSEGALVERRAHRGQSRVTAYESMHFREGSKMLAEAPPIELIYRSADKPPLLEGEIDPAPDLDVDPSLVGCPVCGNDEIDDTETCDDGNTTGGDGCSADCQNENCIAATPGYPEAPLCDDGAGCTEDSCNTSLGGGTCEHVEGDCDDGFDCTADSCAGEDCLHVADHGACDDGNPCTDDTCSGEDGCTNTPNALACDDGNACTDNDHCSDGECAGEHFCAICGDGTITGDEQCDDGSALYATGDWCSALCELVACGQPTSFPAADPKASDALFALKAAVQQVSCSLLVCDVDGNGKVLASDSLRILRLAVGFPIVLACPDSL